jgi:hypothetical protein
MDTGELKGTLSNRAKVIFWDKNLYAAQYQATCSQWPPVRASLLSRMFFSGTSAKLRKATISFVIYVRPSVRLSVRMGILGPHGRIFIKFDIWALFANMLRKLNFYQNLKRRKCTLYAYICTFMVVPRWILLKMRNISERSWRGNQNTYFMSYKLFFWNSVEKYCGKREATNDLIIRRMRYACWITKATDTHSEYLLLFHSNSGLLKAPKYYVDT